ncbi:hypothetical protein ASPVEDRAFT_89164 [Aspergillus versicolor CBS 583.65]|uniref:Uncharacterized protein n=1 Tax=Aspergillus versicolor CBS 583.65 TaxID=1036611 RepID=A0A1L9Q2I6_ASPVE|nr:uncharacterized protein ASPVEDRAFT_89164 [Aspergillus versicolor CBS 583.65]OJJ07931.1 hypothetical protein ASPVEDRAFT_89164 [Aspergillus versicolor CBS 583.65]
MRLHELPVEILYCIADEFEYSWNVKSLTLANSRLYETLSPYLYRFTKQCSATEAFLFGLKYGINSLVRKLLVLKSNDFDERTWTRLLSAAAKRGSLEIMTLFLDAGKQLHASRGWPLPFPRYLDFALWHAMNCRHEPVIRLLLEHGAAPVLHNKTELAHFRGVWKNVSVARLLIRRVRQSTVPDSVSLSHLLQCAIRSSHGCNPEIIQYLLDHEADRSALFGSASEVYGLGYCSDPETVRRLLEYGAGSGLPGVDLTRPLQLAISSGRFNTARVLLEYVDITQALEDRVTGLNLLHMAASTGSEAIVRKLLQGGVSIEGLCGEPDNRNSPLVCAARNGQGDMVKLLLRHGANPHPQALIQALKRRSMSMTRLMLDAGADPNCRSNSSRQTLALEAAMGHEDLFRLLLERGASIPSGYDLLDILKEAVSKGRVSELPVMLDRGVSLANLVFNVLRPAIEGGQQMLEFLYNNGALLRETQMKSKNDKDYSATSLLMTCLFHKRIDSMMWLLNIGLIPTAFCAIDQYEILDGVFRCSRDYHNAESVLAVLEIYGVNLKITPQTNRFAVMSMVNLRCRVALKAFLDRGAKFLLEHVEDPKFLLDCSDSLIHLDMMLNAVLRDSPREQTQQLVLELKEYAHDAKN